jgi:hypothetical protein
VVVLPHLRVKKIQVISLVSVLLNETPAAFGQESKASSECEIDLSSEYSGTEKDVITIPQRPEDVDAVLWNSSIDDSSEQLWSLIDYISSN